MYTRRKVSAVLERIFSFDYFFAEGSVLHFPFQPKSSAFPLPRILSMPKFILEFLKSKRLFKVLQGFIIMAALLFLLDCMINKNMFQSRLLLQAFNTETPEVLFEKVNALQASHGKKIALIGSSLLGGSALANSDKNWRNHTFAQALARRFKKQNSFISIAHFGLNGSTIADQEQIYSVISHSSPVDLLVVTINLECFSMNYSSEQKEYSRDWLKGIAEGKPNLFSIEPSQFFSNTNLFFHRFFMEHWSFYAYRDILQQLAFRDNPGVRIRNLAGKLNDSFSGVKQTKGTEYLQAKHKSYEDIRFNLDNRQIKAFERWLTLLEKRHQKAIILYVPENPGKIDSIIEHQRYLSTLASLNHFLKPFQGNYIKYVPMPVDFATTFPKKGYHDSIHLSASGIEAYSDQVLFPEVYKILFN
jgi:hypothetical protein